MSNAVGLCNSEDLVTTTDASAKTLLLEISDLKSELDTAETDMELRQNESAAQVEILAVILMPAVQKDSCLRSQAMISDQVETQR